MSDETKLYVCATGCVLGWIVTFWIWSATPSRMTTSKLHLTAAAGIGALLPFVPDLVKLMPSLPSAVANALCAVVLAVAYALFPKQSTPADTKSGEAGYVRESLVKVLALAALFSVVACAALQRAEKSPAVVNAITLIRKGDADAVKFCAALPALEATKLLPSELTPGAEQACADLAKANSTTVTVTASTASVGVSFAGAPAQGGSPSK